MKKFSKSHEWVEASGDNAKVGISHHAQELLGDVVFVELPEVGRQIEAGEEVAVVESVKAASSIYSPLSGEVVAINEALEDAPETINADAEGDGWLFEVKTSSFDSESADLMDSEAYDSFSKES